MLAAGSEVLMNNYLPAELWSTRWVPPAVLSGDSWLSRYANFLWMTSRSWENFSSFFLWALIFFLSFFSSPLCVCKSVRVPKVWSYITKSSTWRSRCQVYDNTRRTQDSSGRRRWRLLQHLNVLLDCLLRVLLFALYWPLGPTVIHRSLLLSRFRSRNR